MGEMKVFIYWDNSNIFHEAQRFAEDEEPGARYRVRIHFENLLRLAHADRPLQKAYAVGSVPPEMRSLWNRMEAQGVEVDLFDRGDPYRGEQQMPDHMLQLKMLTDALDYNGIPGIVTLLTGDGAGYLEGAGFHRALERMHKRGWKVEILSWRHSCNQRMRRWAEANGVWGLEMRAAKNSSAANRAFFPARRRTAGAEGARSRDWKGSGHLPLARASGRLGADPRPQAPPPIGIREEAASG